MTSTITTSAFACQAMKAHIAKAKSISALPILAIISATVSKISEVTAANVRLGILGNYVKSTLTSVLLTIAGTELIALTVFSVSLANVCQVGKGFTVRTTLTSVLIC